MKSQAKRARVKRLFILGAGASYSASSTSVKNSHTQTPLDKDFCQRIIDLKTIKPTWVGKAQENVCNEWVDHHPMAEYGLEQAVTRQLGHLEFINAIHPHRKVITIPEYLNDLAHLIAFVLQKTKENKYKTYEKFASYVFPEGVDAGQYTDRIITFNYDDLLDGHIIKRFEIEKIYFDFMKESPGCAHRRSIRFPHPLIIKLHGSVNWRCSREVFKTIIEGTGTEEWIDVWYENTGIPSPKDKHSPLIIPPLPIKPIMNIKLFRFLWTKAYEYLHDAEEIVVCGYSLPEADHHALSLFSNFSNKNLKRVTVVDPDPAILGKWQDLFSRHNVSSSITWMHNKDFSKFINSLKP